MGIFDFDDNPQGWNYSDPTKPGYMQSITGTIVQIDEVQAYNFVTKQPEFFNNGNPKTNVRFIIQGDSGRELPWEFNPGKNKSGIAWNAVKNAMKQYDPNASSMRDLGGLKVKITTTGTSQEIGNSARQWWFEILGPGNAQFRGINPYVHNQQQPAQQPAPVQQQAQQAPPIANDGFYAAPAPTPQPQPQQQAQPAQQQQHQVIQGQPQVIPDGNGGQVYDQDIPF